MRKALDDRITFLVICHEIPRIKQYPGYVYPGYSSTTGNPQKLDHPVGKTMVLSVGTQPHKQDHGLAGTIFALVMLILEGKNVLLHSESQNGVYCFEKKLLDVLKACGIKPNVQSSGGSRISRRGGAWTPKAVTFRKFCMSKRKNLDP